MTNIILAAGLACIVVFIVLSIMITQQVAKRGIKINFLLWRFLLIKYVHQYKQLTKEKTGKIGPLFIPWIISINTALVLVIVTLISLID